MKVCVTEKPSVARDIANILGATMRRGRLRVWPATHSPTENLLLDYFVGFKKTH